jgi:hypothetical protein
VGRPGRQNEKVVGDFPIRQDQCSTTDIYANDVREQHFDVLLPAENPPDRRSDLSRRKRRAGHLIQERLKDVMVPTIEQRNLYRYVSERPSGIQAAESASDDHNMHLSTILEGVS